MDGLFIPNVNKDEFLAIIRETVLSASREAYEELASEKLFTQEQTADILDITKATLIKWGKKGYISPIELGGRVYYKKSEVYQKKNI